MAVFLTARVRSEEPRRLYALCAAFAPELRALRSEFGVSPERGFKRSVINGLEFWQGACDGQDIVVFRTGTSLVNAAYQLQLALDRFPITQVLFMGIAGGSDPSLQVGDVVIPERWAYHTEARYVNEAGAGDYERPSRLEYPYDNFGMIFPGDAKAIRAGDAAFVSMPAFPADAGLLAAARRGAAKMPALRMGGRPIRVVVGGTGVSGPVFVDNARYREWIFRVWQARCIDMESTALAHVAYANRKPILIIRGLSDLAGAQRGPNPIHFNQAEVSANAAHVLHAILDEQP